MTSQYPPTVTDSEEGRLVQAIKDWTIARGLAVRPPPALAASDTEGILAMPAPVTLFPSPFPRVCFDQAKSVQKAYNQLYARISQDEDFISAIVKEVADGDEFIRNLWNVHLKVKEEGYVQPLSLGLFRSDYMVHKETAPDGKTASLQVNQVEFNTIASSFGGLSAQTSALHKFLASTEYPLLENGDLQVDLPENGSTAGLAQGLIASHAAYGKSDLGHPTCVVFLVQDGERNVFDQRHLEYEVQAAGIPVFRLPFSQIFDHTVLADSPKRQLLYRLPSNPSKVFETAVVYFRSAYGPGDYPTPAAWDARYHVERSGAIKCPTVLTQLAGMKKVQQILALPEQQDAPSPLHRFIPEDAGLREKLRGTFTDIYPMDTTPAGLEARKLATDPEACKDFVLKPQREGGGNNFYKASIPKHLAATPEAHWGSYILMKLITPPPVSNSILRNGTVEKGGVICELGMYGTCLWDQASKQILHNEDGGYLLRTKGDQSEEGGVAAGFGCMDSVSLV